MYLNTIKQKQTKQTKSVPGSIFPFVFVRHYLYDCRKFNKNKYKSIELILNPHTILILVGVNVGRGDII